MIPAEPRAEEIIAEVWRQLTLRREQGFPSQGIRLPSPWIRRLRVYRLLLGELQSPSVFPDYLDRDSLFGLDFYVHEAERVEVF